MPKVAIFFCVLLLFPIISNSHAFFPVDLNNEVKSKNNFTFDSDIIDINSNFFTENNFKRYLIFGIDLQKHDFSKLNSIYGIQSDSGFFLYLFYLKI